MRLAYEEAKSYKKLCPLGAWALAFCSAARHGNCLTVKSDKAVHSFHGQLGLHFFRFRANAKNAVINKNVDAPKSGTCLLGLAI